MADKVSKLTVPPIVKEREIGLPVEAAFDRFVRQIDEWWPGDTHSISTTGLERIILEEKTGGRVFERDNDGGEHLWGKVSCWEPPAKCAFSWHVGRNPSTAQLLELEFESLSNERTLLKLTHSGWEALGEKAEPTRHEYQSGWDTVLAHFPYVERNN